MVKRGFAIKIEKFMAVTAISLILLFLSVIYAGIQEVSLKFLCAISLLNTAIVLAIIIKLSKRIFSVSLIFMLFLSVFHFGQTWLYLFDVTVDENISYDIFAIYPHEQIFDISLFCLFSYNLITLFWVFFVHSFENTNKIVKEQEKTHQFLFEKTALFTFAKYLFFILLIPICIYDFLCVRIVAQSGIRGFYDNADRLSFLSMLESYFPFVIIMLLLSCDTKNNIWKWIYYYALVRCLFLMVFTGRRGGYVITLLLYVFCKHCFIKKYNKKHFLWIAIAVLLFLSILSFVSYGRGNYSGMNFFEFIRDNNIIVQTLSEFGCTFTTTVLGYRYTLLDGVLGGKTYLGALAIFMPMSNYLLPGIKQYISVDAILNPYSPIGSGLGGSLFGEMYMNFGYYSLLLTPILAFLVCKIEEISNNLKKHSLFAVSASIYISYGLWIFVRGNFTDVIMISKRTLYIAILYWLFKQFFIRKAKNRRNYI